MLCVERLGMSVLSRGFGTLVQRPMVPRSCLVMQPFNTLGGYEAIVWFLSHGDVMMLSKKDPSLNPCKVFGSVGSDLQFVTLETNTRPVERPRQLSSLHSFSSLLMIMDKSVELEENQCLFSFVTVTSSESLCFYLQT